MSESKRMLTEARYSARFCGFITAPTSLILSHAAVMRSSLATNVVSVHTCGGSTSLWLNSEQVIVMELQVGQHRLLLEDQNTVLPQKMRR